MSNVFSFIEKDIKESYFELKLIKLIKIMLKFLIFLFNWYVWLFFVRLFVGFVI